MSLGDVYIMMFYRRPENVNLAHSIEFITTTSFKYSFRVPSRSKKNWVHPMSHKFCRAIPRMSWLRTKVIPASWSPWDVFRTSILNIIQNTLLLYYFQSYSPKVLLQILKKRLLFLLKVLEKRSEKTTLGWRSWDVPRPSILKHCNKCVHWNTKELANFIVLGFWGNGPKTSYKGSNLTSGGWRSQDVSRPSILNIITKGISEVKFSVLYHQMCVLDTKNLVIAYYFSLEETS